MCSEASKTLHVLIATYNDWACLPSLLARIDEKIPTPGYTCRVTIVDDGSTDPICRNELQDLPLHNITCISVVSLLRNLGNQRALAIGIAYLAQQDCGDFLVIMDADHEDDPAYIPALIRACEAGGAQKLVFAERTSRSEGLTFRLFYGIFQRLYRLATGYQISIGNFSIIPNYWVRRVASIGELWSHYPAAIMRARIPFDLIPSVRAKRFSGNSKMSLVPLIVHALSSFSVHAETIGARTLVMAGLTSVVIAATLAMLVLLKFFTDIPLLGWTSQIGAQLLILLLQVVIAAFVMVFITIAIRMQPAFVPLRDYERFIDKSEVVYRANDASHSC